jgi:hypothetical protein
MDCSITGIPRKSDPAGDLNNDTETAAVTTGLFLQNTILSAFGRYLPFINCRFHLEQFVPAYFD